MRDRLPLIFILVTVVIDSMGIGLIMPVMPDLIRDVGGGTLADAAIWGGILATSFAVMQFLCGPLVGNLSDRFGRRPVLLSALGVMALDYLVMAVAGTIWLLLAGRLAGSPQRRNRQPMLSSPTSPNPKKRPLASASWGPRLASASCSAR